MFGKKRRMMREEYAERVGPVELQKQLESLAVEEGHEVLAAVMSILRGLELMALEHATTVQQPEYERAVRTGQLGALGEAQETILERVEQARAAKAKQADKGRRRPRAMS